MLPNVGFTVVAVQAIQCGSLQADATVVETLSCGKPGCTYFQDIRRIVPVPLAVNTIFNLFSAFVNKTQNCFAGAILGANSPLEHAQMNVELEVAIFGV